MTMLMMAIKLLQSCSRCFLLWLFVPLHSHHARKHVRSDNDQKHRHSQQKPEWLKDEIIRLKAIMPQAGCRTIAGICNRRYAASRQVTIGKTCVHQILQRHDYEIRILRRNLKHAKPKVVPRNLIWGLDLTGKTDANGCLHSLLGIIDHGSRALLHLQALHDKTSHTLLVCLREIIITYGKPKIIRTDNEAIFTSRAFRLGLKQLGIRHQRTDPGCPWQNGRIERLFGTLKHKLDQLTYSPLPLGEGRGEITSDWPACGLITNHLATVFGLLSGMASSFFSRMASSSIREQLNRDLNTFRHWYNHVRPHQNLNGRTPAEAWNGIDPYAKAPKQEHWFEAWGGLLSGYELRY